MDDNRWPAKVLSKLKTINWKNRWWVETQEYQKQYEISPLDLDMPDASEPIKRNVVIKEQERITKSVNNTKTPSHDTPYFRQTCRIPNKFHLQHKTPKPDYTTYIV